MEKDHDKHDFRLRKRTVAVIFPLGRGFYGIFFHQTVKKLAEYFRLEGASMVYFFIKQSKNLQNSSAIKKISVTLSSVNIAIIVCTTLVV